MDSWVTIVVLGVIATAIVMTPIILNIFNKPDDTPEISSYLEMPVEDAVFNQPPGPIPPFLNDYLYEDTPQFAGQPSGFAEYGTSAYDLSRNKKRHAPIGEPEQILGKPFRINVAPQPTHGGIPELIGKELYGHGAPGTTTQKPIVWTAKNTPKPIEDYDYSDFGSFGRHNLNNRVPIESQYPRVANGEGSKSVIFGGVGEEEQMTAEERRKLIERRYQRLSFEQTTKSELSRKKFATDSWYFPTQPDSLLEVGTTPKAVQFGKVRLPEDEADQMFGVGDDMGGLSHAEFRKKIADRYRELLKQSTTLPTRRTSTTKHPTTSTTTTRPGFFKLPSAFGTTIPAEEKPSMTGKFLNGLFSSVLKAGSQAASNDRR